MIPIALNKTALEKHLEMISPQIHKRINDLLGGTNLRKGKGKDLKRIEPTSELREFLKTIKSKDDLKNYLKSDPETLRAKITWFEENLPAGIHRPIGKESSNEDDYYILRSVFVEHGYSHDNFKKLDFIQNLGIDTCSYCNRNYIYTLEKSGKIKPEIDHFYPKGIYPFLAACFYNLIPSCQTCNGFGGKGSEDTFVRGVKSPYEITHEDFHFSFEPVDLDYANPIVPKGVIDIQLNTPHTANSDLFKLDALFKKHEDHVLELIIKSKLEYSAKYREALIDFDEHLFSYEEINRLIVGNYTEKVNLHKRPLSKLYRDIAIDLGLIKPNED